MDRQFKRITYHGHEDKQPFRTDGPGVIDFENNGAVLKWYTQKPGYRHREDGPAVIYVDGGCEWYLGGQIVYPEINGEPKLGHLRARFTWQPPSRFLRLSPHKFEDREYSIRDWVPEKYRYLIDGA